MAKTQSKTESKTEQNAETVKIKDKVKIHYTGSFSDGKVFDSSEGREPLQFVVGAGEVIPGFEQAVKGMKLNEEKKVHLPAKEGYGEIRAELIQEIPRKALPEKPEPQVGMQLIMQAPDGRKLLAIITKINEDKITLDLNHPLAGKDLQFKVKVVSINEPKEEAEKAQDIEHKTKDTKHKTKDTEHTCDCSNCESGCH
jgi:FKBP-type peptidyl-prolyl cis-trans isomerase 2